MTQRPLFDDVAPKKLPPLAEPERCPHCGGGLYPDGRCQECYEGKAASR